MNTTNKNRSDQENETFTSTVQSSYGGVFTPPGEMSSQVFATPVILHGTQELSNKDRTVLKDENSSLDSATITTFIDNQVSNAMVQHFETSKVNEEMTNVNTQHKEQSNDSQSMNSNSENKKGNTSAPSIESYKSSNEASKVDSETNQPTIDRFNSQIQSLSERLQSIDYKVQMGVTVTKTVTVQNCTIVPEQKDRDSEEKKTENDGCQMLRKLMKSRTPTTPRKPKELKPTIPMMRAFEADWKDVMQHLDRRERENAKKKLMKVLKEKEHEMQNESNPNVVHMLKGLITKIEHDDFKTTEVCYTNTHYK